MGDIHTVYTCQFVRDKFIAVNTVIQRNLKRCVKLTDKNRLSKFPIVPYVDVNTSHFAKKTPRIAKIAPT